jgi:hypothetical protein
MGRWPVIDALFTCFAGPDAIAFQDRNLPFFVMHARLWFLLAVARIALDHPGEILRHRAMLENIALDDAFPHVAFRDSACRALLACLRRTKDQSSKALLKLLKLGPVFS